MALDGPADRLMRRQQVTWRPGHFLAESFIKQYFIYLLGKYEYWGYYGPILGLSPFGPYKIQPNNHEENDSIGLL